MEAHQQELDHVLGGLHDLHDDRSVMRTTFQALYDVAHAQSHAVREVERKLEEVHDALVAALNKKADAVELRSAVALANEARAAADLVAQRVEEEAQCTLDAQKSAAEDVHALRYGLSDLRAAVERQSTDVQQWRAGFEAGLSRLVAECSGAAQAARQECTAALRQDVERLEAALMDKASTRHLSEEREAMRRELDELSAALERAASQQDLQALREAVEEKATPGQLRQIVREAWQREEGQFAQLRQLCESKVSVGDFAALAALAEGKASHGDVEVSVQRHVERRVGAALSEQQLLTQEEAMSILEAASSSARERVRECEHRVEELARRLQRAAAAADDARGELRMVASTKLERGEVEALVAGALADWVRAAKRGEDAVHNALLRGRASPGGGDTSWCGLSKTPSTVFSEGRRDGLDARAAFWPASPGEGALGAAAADSPGQLPTATPSFARRPAQAAAAGLPAPPRSPEAAEPVHDNSWGSGRLARDAARQPGSGPTEVVTPHSAGRRAGSTFADPPRGAPHARGARGTPPAVRSRSAERAFAR